MNPSAPGSRKRRKKPVDAVTLNVKGMTCNHCVLAVKRSLEAVEGVRSADVTLSPPQAVVFRVPSQVTVDRLTEATGKEGYPSTVAG